MDSISARDIFIEGDKFRKDNIIKWEEMEDSHGYYLLL